MIEKEKDMRLSIENRRATQHHFHRWVYIVEQIKPMLCQSYFSLLGVFFLWTIADSHLSAPFDLRIDHHKVDTTRDLIINTPRPKFSWKISYADNIRHRNVQQTAYQMQLQSLRLTEKDQLFQWDSDRIMSSQSIHVLYTCPIDLLPSTYYLLRLRIWTMKSNEPSKWTKWIKFRTSIFNLHEYLTNLSDLLWIGFTEINMNELRKEFLVPDTSPIKSAIVYMTGLGYYEFHLNGYKVDPSRKLDPGWSTYEKRTLIVSYDVTPNITV